MTTPLIPPVIDATLVLVRHGESTWIAEDRFQGRRDPPLSPRGEWQARLVATRLADPAAPPPLPIPTGPPLAIWHSPLRRAGATAAAITAAVRATTDLSPLVPEPGLSEIGQGEWEGLLSSHVVERYADDLARWRRAPVGNEAPGGERLIEADARVRVALAAILPALAGDTGPAAGAGGADQPGCGRARGSGVRGPGLGWREVVGQVVGAQDGAAITELDDRDAGQDEGKGPEPLEGHVE